MPRKKLMLLPLGVVGAITLGGCTPADLVPRGIADLEGETSHCTIAKEGPDKGKLIVTVLNQGHKDAPASTTTVEFLPGGTFAQPTPPVGGEGGTADVKFNVPPACWTPDCSFKVTVDSKNQVWEANKGNNTVPGTCPASWFAPAPAEGSKPSPQK